METTPNTNPAIKSGILRALLFLLIGFIFCAIVQAIFTTVIHKGFLYQGSKNDNDIGNILQSYTITKIGFILCAWWCMEYINKQPFFSLGFAWKKHHGDALAGFIIALAILIIGTFILLFNNNIYYTTAHFSGLDFLLSIVLFVVVAFIEEIAIRGYLLNNLMHDMNKWLALFVSAIIFSLIHVNNPDFGLLAFINVFVAGIFLGVNYVYTKNLWFGIFLHFGWNFFQGPVLGFKVSGIAFNSFFKQVQQGSEIMTGGSFGFEGSIISALLQLVAIAGLVWYYGQRKTGFRVLKKR